MPNGPIQRFLEADHARLDALLAGALAAPQADGAAYLAFREGLLRHIAMEEKVLLPEARRRQGRASLPGGDQLRADHRALAALLVPPPSPALLETVGAVLAEHNPLEEGPGALYAFCEQLVRRRGRRRPRAPGGGAPGQGVAPPGRAAESGRTWIGSSPRAPRSGSRRRAAAGAWRPGLECPGFAPVQRPMKTRIAPLVGVAILLWVHPRPRGPRAVLHLGLREDGLRVPLRRRVRADPMCRDPRGPVPGGLRQGDLLGPAARRAAPGPSPGTGGRRVGGAPGIAPPPGRGLMQVGLWQDGVRVPLCRQVREGGLRRHPGGRLRRRLRQGGVLGPSAPTSATAP